MINDLLFAAECSRFEETAGVKIVYTPRLEYEQSDSRPLKATISIQALDLKTGREHVYKCYVNLLGVVSFESALNIFCIHMKAAQVQFDKERANAIAS